MQNAVLAWQRMCIVVQYVVMSAFGSACNIAASYFLIKKKKMTDFSILLLSLAYSDLLLSLLSPITFIHDLLAVEGKWHLGSSMCSFLPAAVSMLLSASSWSIVAIGIERLRMLGTPFRNEPPGPVSYAKPAVIWILSGTISIPYTFAWRYNGDKCEESFDHMRRRQMFIYLVILNVLIWAIPFLFLAVSYGISSRELKKSMLTHANSHGVAKQLRKNRRALRRMVLLVASFFTSNLPYSIFFCVIWHKKVFHNDVMTPDSVSKLKIWNCLLFTFCLISSCVNPWIYGNIYNYLSCCRQRLRGRSTDTKPKEAHSTKRCDHHR